MLGNSAMAINRSRYHHATEPARTNKVCWIQEKHMQHRQPACVTSCVPLSPTMYIWHGTELRVDT
jgi:hypothetical protein